jgi:hypothetical protein
VQEATASTIDLSYDDPDALVILIHYFYNFHLDTSIIPIPEGEESTTYLPTFLVKIYAIADKYDVQPLLSPTITRLSALCDRTLITTNIPAFISCVLAVEENTRDAPESYEGLWGTLLPAASANMEILLEIGGFWAGFAGFAGFCCGVVGGADRGE